MSASLIAAIETDDGMTAKYYLEDRGMLRLIGHVTVDEEHELRELCLLIEHAGEKHSPPFAECELALRTLLEWVNEPMLVAQWNQIFDGQWLRTENGLLSFEAAKELSEPLIGVWTPYEQLGPQDTHRWVFSELGHFIER